MLVMEIPAKKVIFTSFAVDILDIILSVIATVLSGSMVMASQILRGTVDLSASGFLAVGIHRSQKSPDREHPFGYGRELYFWAMLSSLVILGFTSTTSLYFGWRRFLNPEPISDLSLAYLSLVIGAVTNGYAFSLSFRRLKRHWDAKDIWAIFFRSSLVETKTTFILDLMGTLASIFGLAALIIYGITGDGRYDGLGAMVIGLLLGFFSLVLLVAVKDLLVGRGASPEMERQIFQASGTVSGVKKVLSVNTLYMGPEKLLVHVDVQIKNDLSTQKIEEIIFAIKDNVKYWVKRASEIKVEIHKTP